MICPVCGNVLPDGAAICNVCGNRFETSKAPDGYYKESQARQSQMQIQGNSASPAEHDKQRELYDNMQRGQRSIPVYQGQPGPIPQGQPGPIPQGQPGPIPQGQPGPIPQGQLGPVYQGQPGPIPQSPYGAPPDYGNVNLTKPPQYQQGAEGKKALAIVLSAVAGVVILIVLVMLGVSLLRKNISNEATEPDKDNTTAASTEEPVQNDYNSDYADYTVMIYMIGSNLESGESYDSLGFYLGDGGNATTDLDQIAEADIGDNVNVILETGGTEKWINNYGMKDGHVQRFELKNKEYIEKDDLGQPCMCHEDQLEDFLVWGKENYPANNYILILWDHGCGATTAAFGYDTNADEEDTLQINDMAEAMKNSGIRYEFTLFNACLMGSLEMADAISPYCDYMIASEESIWTFGYYYTNWLTELSENPDIDMESLADIIIDDFVAQYDYWNEDYRNSNADSDVTDYYSYELALIDTAAAHEVVPELSEMFTVADQELYDSRLTDFLTAREKCGDFSGTYSADIVEFCTNYGVDGYEDVIAAVDTAVVTVESNISYANGLSFYIPEASEDGCVYYSYDGRINLENLDFDQECIKFYDDVLSAYAGYAYVDDISELGMESYYNEALVDAYSDTYVAYADATDFNMDYTYENGKYILDLGEDFEYVSFLEQRVGFDYKENNALVLGSDFNVLSWDDTGKVDITFPDKWLYVDGQIVCYVVTDHVTNTDGSVTMTGVIPFIFTEDNSRIYGIVIQWGSDRGVTVKGYTEIDTTDLSFVDGYMYSLYDGMEITFCYALVTHDGNQVDEDSTVFVTMGDSHTYDKSGFSITYGDINQVYDLLGTYGENAKGYSYVKVYDLFDNANITDLVPQN